MEDRLSYASYEILFGLSVHSATGAPGALISVAVRRVVGRGCKSRDREEREPFLR